MKHCLISCFCVAWLAVLVAACTRPDTAAPCPLSTESAVIVYLRDDQGLPLDDVTLTYRLNDELEQPIRLDGEGGVGIRPGRYTLRAEKAGYQTAETAVIVPPKEQSARGPGCGVVTQNAHLQLARVCGATTAATLPVTFVATPLTAANGQRWQPNDLSLVYRVPPDQSWQTADCVPTDAGTFTCTLPVVGHDWPATIDFRAGLPGYPYARLTRTIEYSPTGCLRPTEPLRFQPESACAEDGRFLQVEVTSPTGEPLINTLHVAAPGIADFTPAACGQVAGDRCRSYTLDLATFGAYQLIVADLPHEATVQIENGIVNYSYDGYNIHLAQGQNSRIVSGTSEAAVGLDLTVQADETGCPQVDLSQVTRIAVLPPPFQSGTSEPDVQISQQGSLLLTGFRDAACLVQPQLTAVTYEVTLPAGTRLADVAVYYQVGDDAPRQTAECRVEANRYLCTAIMPNPIVGQGFTILADVAGVQHVGTRLPSSGLCMIFR